MIQDLAVQEIHDPQWRNNLIMEQLNTYNTLIVTLKCK